MTNPKFDRCAARTYVAPPQTWASKDCTRSGHAIFDTFGIFERDQQRPAQRGMTMAVDSMAIRKVTGVGTATALSTFSAIVHNNSADRCKLFLRLGIGDGAFPESAKKRHLAVRLAAGDTPLKRHGQSATSEPKGLRTESRKRDERTHRRVGSRIELTLSSPFYLMSLFSGCGDKRDKRYKRFKRDNG